MEKLKVGVIGCGRISQGRHLPELAANPNVEITVVCDNNEERASEAAVAYGSKAFSNYHEMLKDPELDAVTVCTPNYLHASISIDALNAGKHVLCEKPMATSKEDAVKMVEAAKKNGKKLMIAHNQRFLPAHVKAKELIKNGKLGKVYSFRTSFGHSGPETWSVDETSWFFKKEQSFVGALGDLGVHKVDVLRYVLGEEITEVASLTETKAKSHSSVEDIAVALLKTSSGIIGTMTASWCHVSKPDNSTIIYGQLGIIRCNEDPEHPLVVQYSDGTTVKYNTPDKEDTNTLKQFVDCIIHDTPVPVPGEEGMKSFDVILAALESNLSKRIIKLSNYETVGTITQKGER